MSCSKMSKGFFFNEWLNVLNNESIREKQVLCCTSIFIIILHYLIAFIYNNLLNIQKPYVYYSKL